MGSELHSTASRPEPAPSPPGGCLQGSRHSQNGFHGEQQKSGPRVFLAHVVLPGATAWSRTGAGQASVMLFLTPSQTPTIFRGDMRQSVLDLFHRTTQKQDASEASLLPRASEMHITALPQLTWPEKFNPMAGTPVNLFLAVVTCTDT